MKKNISNSLALMAWICTTINNAIETYEVSLFTLFGFGRSHFSYGDGVITPDGLIELKNDIHEFFGTLDSMGVLRIIPIDKLLKTVKEQFGLLGISYMELGITVSSSDETVEEFQFPKWDTVMKRFGRNVEKIGRTNIIFKELHEDGQNNPLSRVWTKIRFTKEGDAITFDGTLLTPGEADVKEFYFSLDDYLVIREHAWTLLLKNYDLKDLKDYWY